VLNSRFPARGAKEEENMKATYEGAQKHPKYFQKYNLKISDKTQTKKAGGWCVGQGQRPKK
jgi:hypothetical protein